MTFKDRIGVDVGRSLSVEDAIAWAADKGVSYIDCQIDLEPNALETFDDTRCGNIRDLAAEHGVKVGLHTLSAVNIAEVSPFVRDAVDDYLSAYIDAAARTRAGWIVVHAGYHFTADREPRMAAALERLKRATAKAESAGVTLLLENMNWEPDRAEVHYLGHTIEECHYYFDQISSPHLGWAYTINHATLVPEGVSGFLDAMPSDRLGEVRLADNNGEYEIHLFPGEGIINFPEAFTHIEASGYRGHYMNAFGSLDDMLRGRDVLAASYRNSSTA